MNFKYLAKKFFLIILLKIYFPNVIFEVVDRPEDLKKMYDLIWQVYGVEKKYIDISQSSPQTFKDEYEKHSIVIGAFKGNNIIGSLRLILPSPRLYVEEDFNIEFPRFSLSEIAEISRLTVLKKYRTKGLISFGLLKKAFRVSKKSGIKHWIVVVSEKLKEYFSKSFGVEFRPLKTGKLTEGQIKTRNRMMSYYKINKPSPYIISLIEL